MKAEQNQENGEAKAKAQSSKLKHNKLSRLLQLNCIWLTTGKAILLPQSTQQRRSATLIDKIWQQHFFKLKITFQILWNFYFAWNRLKSQEIRGIKRTELFKLFLSFFIEKMRSWKLKASFQSFSKLQTSRWQLEN